MQECIQGFKSLSLRHEKRIGILPVRFSLYIDFERDLRVGAVLREQNALPNGGKTTENSTAKSTIDNCRAGRAAKGANILLSARKEL